jgi:epoxide hydrolase-like predicted phosphatase
MIIRAIIFDLGGVLLRTHDFTSREQLAARLGKTRQELERLVFTGPDNNRAQRGEIALSEHWKNVLASLELDEDQLESFQAEFWRGDFLDEDLVDYVRGLRGRYRTALLSNAFDDLRDLLCNTWKIDDAFDVIIISAEERMMKPDARIYHLAAERLGVKPQEAVFVDDLIYNVRGARDAGLHAIQFQSPDQLRLDLERLLETA